MSQKRLRDWRRKFLHRQRTTFHRAARNASATSGWLSHPPAHWRAHRHVDKEVHVRACVSLRANCATPASVILFGVGVITLDFIRAAASTSLAHRRQKISSRRVAGIEGGRQTRCPHHGGSPTKCSLGEVCSTCRMACATGPKFPCDFSLSQSKRGHTRRGTKILRARRVSRMTKMVQGAELGHWKLLGLWTGTRQYRRSARLLCHRYTPPANAFKPGIAYYAPRSAKKARKHAAHIYIFHISWHFTPRTSSHRSCIQVFRNQRCQSLRKPPVRPSTRHSCSIPGRSH